MFRDPNEMICQRCFRPEPPLLAQGKVRIYEPPEGVRFVCSTCVCYGLGFNPKKDFVERPKPRKGRRKRRR